ncbi:DUF1565 domain-containing protein [Tahibacter amnicola]|uniref:Right-handed parallel beta-helix repeat-containing protein n=1 Tax=Tahibacter amnicola TaxID=2976241 RepID=A0ABY6B9R1_9GAMM|nr:DUF1565 domain-containing protein [Tahibacter amnicola]UXI66292.1 right-handed parallel beta-helix repeat-containing protein [Tahibacter amnicola]
MVLRLSCLAVVLFCGAASAARPDASVVAGARALPDLRFLQHEAQACTHFVATNGNDTADGLAGRPWKTIGKALRTLSAGQVGCVASGTYLENAAQPTHSGQLTAPIVLKRQPGSATRPIVRPNGNVAVFHMDKDYWIVDGFEVDVAQQTVTGFRWWSSADFGVLRNSVLHGTRAGANVYVSGRDFLLEDSEIYDNYRADGEDSHGVLVPAESTNAARILIRRNTIHDNGGDSFQCEHASSGNDPTTPRDITLEDNRYYNSPQNYGRGEQGIDIKSCRQITIRGSVPPDTDHPNVAGSKFYGFREVDGSTGRGGGAIVVHFGAKEILIENSRFWESCNALGVGRGDDSSYLTANVVFRRNVVFNLWKNSVSGTRCKGYGIQLNRVDNVDVYHNTFDNLPGTAFYATDYNVLGVPNRNIDFWNNIVRNAEAFLSTPTSTSQIEAFVSDRNLFWNGSSTTAGIRVGGSMKTLAQWRGYGGSGAIAMADPTGNVTDPQFVADPVNADYHLLETSPGRDAAIANTGSAYADGGPDIGFLENYPTDRLFQDGFE